MSDKMRVRPKSTASVRGVQLNYPGMKSADSWKSDITGMPTWASDNSTMLGIQGSKCMPHTWQMSLHPQSGGFLPVLKGKSKTASTNRTLKRTKSATTRHANASGGKIIPSNTASLLDLTAIIPSQRKPIANFYRQNSMSADFKVVSQPVLRYSHDSGVTSVLSKLDLLERGMHRSASTGSLVSSVTGSKLKGNSGVSDNTKSSNTIRESSKPSNVTHDKSTTNNVVQDNSIPSRNQLLQKPQSNDITEHVPAPPSTPRPESAAEPNGLINSTDNSDNELAKTDKWKLNVTIPDNIDSSSDEGKVTEKTSNSPDEIQTITDINDPTLKHPVNELEPPTKKTVNFVNHLQNKPKPPTTRPQGSIIVSKKRITRAKVLEPKDAGSENSTDTLSESDTMSVDPENDSSIMPDGSNSKIADLPKSVRFPEQPANIKEYYPWEPPLNSIVYHEHKPVPRKPVAKSTPVFRP